MRKLHGRFVFLLALFLGVCLFSLSRQYVAICKEAPNLSKQYVHISIDDVSEVLRDLTLRQNDYATMFDNPTLAFLKYLHEKYGAIFSLYVFYTHDGFDLSKVPSKYSGEFARNASWLKFGFHSFDAKTKYNSVVPEKAHNDYQLVMSELQRITGCNDCLDRFPRLHAFLGNRESLSAMSTGVYGLSGLLGADDERASYYLSLQESNNLRKTGAYCDSKNHLAFISTDFRLENISDMNGMFSPEYALSEMADGYLVVFTHESFLGQYSLKKRIFGKYFKKTKLEKFCKCAADRGYTFIFPADFLRISPVLVRCK